ncbi:MAG: type II toxin-antitoxin system RelE/ParE family toxin [Bacteroidota bacterium]
MPYSLNFSRQAFKELEQINEPFYSKVKLAISTLALDPRPYGYKKLKGRTGYRIKVGIYRIIYDIVDTELIVDVITIGHRKDVYD